MDGWMDQARPPSPAREASLKVGVGEGRLASIKHVT